ncbi:MAG: YdeI/OmpD-associated family protein [Anaerolineaceae bacterium]|nr:YdeI/OmpD-associated family protein [Anaerolineaceae bacterium]
MKKELKNPGVVEFSAPIIDPGGGGAYIEFPFDTEKLFGTIGRIPVKVHFDGQPYHGTMLRYGTEKHIIIIVKKIREAIKKQAPEIVNIKVELDDKTREITVPDDVQKSLENHPLALEKYQKLAYTHQKEYINWILEAKREETRQNRIEKMIQRLLDQG